MAARCDDVAARRGAAGRAGWCANVQLYHLAVMECFAGGMHAGGLKPAAGSTKPAEAGSPGREPASAGLVSVAAGFILRRGVRPNPPCRNIRHTHPEQAACLVATNSLYY